ncbi:Disease resistance protein RGA2 [Rhynchospora pubera]|uniref:Disease resistance protein RGA2 n=1 Tax=Rhynchospora pubera TaxID=906938 RepID=A0AAV8C4I0_9POAL|nr:Disease resistance protein RGA2 [Rhynchospora pubera]
MHYDPHEILDALKPYSNLKVLQVAQYPGNKFPVWMTEYETLANLIELYIIDCRKCTKIPPVNKLPSLQILYLKFFDNLSHLCNSGSTRGDIDGDSQKFFTSLNKLVLFEMPNLSSWCEVEVRNETSLVFPKLKKLEIINCPKLTAMPDVPKLKELSVKGNKTLSCIATRLSTLRVLSLEKHGGDTESTNEILSFQSWVSLDRLELSGYNSIVPIGTNEGEEPRVTPTKCHSLQLKSSNFLFSLDVVPNSLLWLWKCFMFVKFLSIHKCDNFIYWPQKELTSLNYLTYISVLSCLNFLGSQQESPYERSITETLLPKLKSMMFSHCPNMVEIPKCSASIQTLEIIGCEKLQCLPEWLGSMVALKDLEIGGCKNMHSLPSSIGGLTSLEKLNISNCPNLGNLPAGMEGLKALELLQIIECPNLKVLPEGLLQQLKNLDELWIERCPHLEWKFRIHCKYRSLTSKIPIAWRRSSGFDLAY